MAMSVSMSMLASRRILFQTNGFRNPPLTSTQLYSTSMIASSRLGLRHVNVKNNRIHSSIVVPVRNLSKRSARGNHRRPSMHKRSKSKSKSRPKTKLKMAIPKKKTKTNSTLQSKPKPKPKLSTSELDWSVLVQNCTRIVQTTTQRQQQQRQKLQDSSYRTKIQQKLWKSIGTHTNTESVTAKETKQNATVPEHQRKKFKEMLQDLKRNPRMDRLEMPPDLTKDERKVLNQLAFQMGLASKSHGSGKMRRIVIGPMLPRGSRSRSRSRSRHHSEIGSDVNVPWLKVGREGMVALENYVRLHPPTNAELQSMQDSYVDSSVRGGGKNGGSENPVNVFSFPNASPERDGISSSSQRNSRSWNVIERIMNYVSSNRDETETPGNHDGMDPSIASTRMPRNMVTLNRRAKLHQQAQEAKRMHPKYHQRQTRRTKLPAYDYQHEVYHTIQSNRVTILQGDTGCGKSTQVPQFLLDSPEGSSMNIAVTQPRRISATSLAERVASERCERTGMSVGYSVRMDTAASEHTQILYLTPGVLLKKFHSDPELKEFTHIVVDEIHERDKHTEFLMIVLKDLVMKRKDLRVILMSATLDIEELKRHWTIEGSKDERVGNGEDSSDSCSPAVISVPGRTFPVQTFFLEDILRMIGAFEVHGETNHLTNEDILEQYGNMRNMERLDNELILETVKFIENQCHEDGAILIFLPGWQEISALMQLFEETHPFNNKDKYLLLTLHSGVSSKLQKLVFEKPPKGVRKIILSTNIAETSVTINDVAFVIDSGRAKEKSYDPHSNTSTLQPVWISQASVKQRRGRAGRTQPGLCFHLFSREQHNSFREYLESELLRTSLEEICLQIKKLDLAPGGVKDPNGVPAFLSAAIVPPSKKSITAALDSLIALGAMDKKTNLTPLGHCLSRLSVDPKHGKMIVWAYVLGCSKDAVAMAVGMSHKSPFILPPPAMRREAEETKIDISQESESDQITMLKVLNSLDNFQEEGLEHHYFNYCKSNFINVSTIEMISDLRQNVARELSSIGYLDPAEMKGWHNRNGSNQNLTFLQSAIVAGVFPNVASRQEEAHYFDTATNLLCKIHRSSVNGSFKQPLSSKKSVLHQLVAYGEMTKGIGAHYTINQTTRLSSSLPILLLCGEFSVRQANRIDTKGGDASQNIIISVDKWISVQCNKETVSAMALLRKRLDLIFQKVVSDPRSQLSQMDVKTLRAIDILMKSAHEQSLEEAS